LWSLHPQYLDTQGLLALWRESLLAQKVLNGHTTGYQYHPQLERFKKHPRPSEALAAYLLSVWKESRRRGYGFNLKKVGARRAKKKIPVTQGQLQYEFRWLCRKLKKRSPRQYHFLTSKKKVRPHPFFYLTQGPMEDWERPKL
jgi:hypothetical protein